jgi:hypothetical protein
MRVEIVSENVGAGIMVLGCMQLEKYSHACSKIKL